MDRCSMRGRRPKDRQGRKPLERISRVNAQMSRRTRCFWVAATGARRFCETKPNPSVTLPGEPGDVDVHGERRLDVPCGGAGNLQALELMEGPVEAPLYGGLVA